MSITPTGFDSKTQAEIEQEIKQAFTAQFGSKNLLPTSVLGQIISIISQKLREQYEVQEAVYSSFNPNAASGQSLDNLAALTGTIRLQPTATTVTLDLDLNAATTVPQGSLVSNPATEDQFSTDAEVTSVGAGTYSVAATAVNTGPISALSGSITQIDTPVGGWNSVTNPLDGDPGTDLETDEELRLRRQQLLQAQGAAVIDAIQADVLSVDGVTEAVVFQNTGDVVDALGLPPHSVRAVVRGGVDQDIGEALADTVAAGIATDGTITVQVTANNDQIIDYSFSRPTVIDIYVEVDATTDASYVPGTIEDAIGESDVFTIGEDVFSSKLYEIALDVPGVLDVPSIDVGTAPAPVGTQVVIGPEELADLDSSRVTVT